MARPVALVTSGAGSTTSATPSPTTSTTTSSKSRSAFVFYRNISDMGTVDVSVCVFITLIHDSFVEFCHVVTDELGNDKSERSIADLIRKFPLENILFMQHST